MAVLLKADGDSATITPKNGRTFELAELQAHVGGYIDIVRLGHKAILVVNDEGLVHGLPLNEAASRMAGGTIVGDAVLCKDGEVE